MKHQLVMVLVMGVGIVSLFQNCGQQVTFGADGLLTKINVNDSDVAGAGAEVSEPTGTGTAAPAPEESTPESDDPAPSAAPGSSASNNEGNRNYNEDGEEGSEEGENENDDSDSDSRGRYICIVDGPGKSEAIGFVDNKLVSQHATPKVVCMSQNACENIISKKFDVKSAERRGYCPKKNKHVVPLSDKELEALI